MSMVAHNYLESESRTEERIVMFPTFGHRSADGRAWKIEIWGAVFEPAPNNLRRRMLIKVLQRLMKVESEQLDTPTFRKRSELFLISTERGKRMAVQTGSLSQMVQRPSKRNGHFRGSLLLDDAQILKLSQAGCVEDNWLKFDVAMPGAGKRLFAGQAQLIPETGISVISDIDDTIKDTEVTDQRKLLRNTFLNDFRAVDGMADVYRQWRQAGAAFHYVSSSPWQLVESLSELLTDHQFPMGSLHLRSIRLRDPSVLQLFVARRYSKRRVIRSILRMFPQRSFVLVGDSGEKDAEIYGAMARRFPHQVKQILIRRVGGIEHSRDRTSKAFKGVASSTWRFFDEPAELADIPIKALAAR